MGSPETRGRETTTRRATAALTALVLAALLSSCADPEDAPFEELSAEDVIAIAPERAAKGESVGLGVSCSTAAATSVAWEQTAGPPVVIQADRSKLVGFDVPAAGEYAFAVHLTTTAGRSVTRSLSFVAEDGGPVHVNARLDHAVSARGNVSLRATHDLGRERDVTYSWRQLAGPAASEVSGSSGPRLVFRAPDVALDTLLRFEVTVSSAARGSASDEALVLVEPAGRGWPFGLPGQPSVVAKVRPYRPSSPYASQLATCLYSNAWSNCPLDRLPLIAGDAPAPSVDQIMDRLLVSHDWMGRRFEEFLTGSDPSGDLKRLMRAITGIVISHDVNTTRYQETGGIFLQGGFLWQTPEERDTIDENPDFRSGFGTELQFAMPRRWVKDDDYLAPWIAPGVRRSRTLADTRLDLAAVLYHELAHANDFLPPTSWAALPSNQSPTDAGRRLTPSSSTLARELPLASARMRALASVQFAGQPADPTQKSYLPRDVVGFFEPDRATDFYSYSTQFEDFAELFTDLMMRYRFGVDADVAVTNRPTFEGAWGIHYIVSWGERGRIGEDRIKPRADRAATAVYTTPNTSPPLAALRRPKLMTPGRDWESNLALDRAVRETRADSQRTPRPVQLLPHD